MKMQNPNSGIVFIKDQPYQTVAARLKEFRNKYPVESGWSIETECIVFSDEKVVFKAVIKNPEGRIIATGHAEEKRDSCYINRTSAMENAETSAIGRSLAAAGFVGSHFATADEVFTAQMTGNETKRNNGSANTNGSAPALNLPDVSKPHWEINEVPALLLPHREREKGIKWGELIFDTVELQGSKRTLSGAQYLRMLHKWDSALAQSPDVKRVVEAAIKMREQAKADNPPAETVASK